MRPVFWMLAFVGFVFLYAPIVVLVVYSFNASELVTVWGGFSLRWYGALFSDAQIGQAFRLSLLIAATSATLAVVLGTMTALALVRIGGFWGRPILAGMATAPLVMPEVITGLSLLLLFVAMERTVGWPAGRGIATVILAHSVFCLAYVAVVVQSRLLGLEESLEEAAADLGARPYEVMRDVTLPLIAPALAAGWLLAFTLSLDDVVVASFVSGPGASTLPMVIFSKVRLGVSPDVNALATLIIVAVALGLIGALILVRRQR